MKQPNHSAIIRRRINMPRSKVFDAFCTSEALVKWFSPSPSISIEILEFKFRDGGTFRICYYMPDGSKKGVRGTYDGIAPPDELSFTWVWDEPDPHAGLETHVKIQLLEKGDETEIILTHTKLPSEDVATHHGEGWKGILDGLERLFAATLGAAT